MADIIATPVPSVSIVVARYKEPLEWIPEHWLPHIFLYNKGPTPPPKREYHSITNLPNVGREGHTYLHHIIENYENLTDVIYFTQAYPFDHAPDLVNKIESGIIGVLGDKMHTVYEHDVTMYERNYPGIQRGFDRVILNLFGGNKWWQVIRFTPGAIFSVTREQIMQHPKTFYQECIKLLNYHSDPIEGYTFERIWPIIFNL